MEKKSNNSHSKSANKADPKVEPLTEDLDFWNMETDITKIDQTSEELDELEEFLKSPVLPTTKTKTLSDLSENPIELEELDDIKIIKKLEEANTKREQETVVQLSEEDLKEYAQQEVEEKQEIIKKEIQKRQSKPKRTPVEKIATVVCVLFLLGLGFYLYSYSVKRLDIKTEEEWVSNIPTAGEFISIEEVSTGWSRPESGAKLGVILVPTATITLSDDIKSGAIRVIFYSYEEGLNGKKRAKGDPFPLEVIDGKFANGRNTITLAGTDGFTDIADFYSYRSQFEKRWTVVIKEAQSMSVPAGSFNDVGHAPIIPDRLGIE